MADNGIIVDGNLVLFSDLPYRELVISAKKELKAQIRTISPEYGYRISCIDCPRSHYWDDKVSFVGVFLDNFSGYFEITLNIDKSQADKIIHNMHKMGHIRRHKVDDSIERYKGGVVEFLV